MGQYREGDHIEQRSSCRRQPLGVTEGRPPRRPQSSRYMTILLSRNERQDRSEHGVPVPR
jgi:hypothetical protein